MRKRGNSVISSCPAAGAAVGLILCVLSTPAAAQGLFESFLGELGRALSGPPPAPPSGARAFTDPFTELHDTLTERRGRPEQHERDERVVAERDYGPSKAFCVRTCDGRYLPVQSRPGMSAAQACQAFCPASQTRLYAGSNIDYAVARDGSRYAALPNAYVYRRQLVDGCTCNGRDAFGLANIEIDNDPTLRRGDVVATSNGLVAYTGDDNRRPDFTPVESYSGFSRSYRETLSDIRVTPPSAVNHSPVKLPLTTGSTGDITMRSAKLDE